MGSSVCSCPHVFSKNIEVPDLKLRSSYGEHNERPDEKILQTIFNQSYQENRKSMIAQKIKANPQQFFQDDKFILDSKEHSRLSVLFDFEKTKTKVYSKNIQPDSTIFVQLNIELCYLTCVQYFLCRKQPRETLMKQIIETKQLNKYGAYSLNFFCNGEKHNILIDDKMPTKSDGFIYCRMVKGVQLWPLIIEKAWCKQIGSYKNAKGLSPQDAFQQITGIPAYSYEFKSNNRGEIKRIITANPQKNWVALVARNGLEDLINRQVFYLQSIDQNNNYTIVSPYSSFVFNNYKQQKRGEVKVKEQDIFTHFQFAAVGFYRRGYANTWINIDSKRHEEVLIEIQVKRRQDVCIRFHQLYEGYIKEQQQQYYDYSPVLIELYQVNERAGAKSSYSLVKNCQGCSRSVYGARTVHLNNNIFESLEGKYLVRLEVNWSHENIHRGNLAVYSSEGNVSVVPLKNNGQMRTEVYRDVLNKIAQKDSINILNEHGLEVRSYDKKYSTLFSFKNLYHSTQTFQVDFNTSQNILIRGGEVRNNKTTIKIEGEDLTIIQVLPLNIRQGIVLENFILNKIQKSTK